jgi:hypothetical protein
MANELQFYDAAKAALSKAVRVDEVKKIHDKAAAYKAAAKIAKDKTLEADAAEIRMRAERRLGELMEQQKKTVGLNKGGGDKKSKHRDSTKPGGNTKPTLKEAGIDKNLAQRARSAAKPSAQEFELKVEAAKEQIKSPVKLNIKQEVRMPKRVRVELPDATEQCVKKVHDLIVDTVAQMRRGGGGEQKVRFLFQKLSDELRAIENKMLPPKSVEQSVEERRAVNAKLAKQDASESASA